jgi:hypothetical protein
LLNLLKQFNFVYQPRCFSAIPGFKSATRKKDFIPERARIRVCKMAGDFSVIKAVSAPCCLDKWTCARARRYWAGRAFRAHMAR